ncbi:MAG: adenylate/guanylate cyclase domain-containing protein [Cyclobacteriaceae bacterium]
MRYFLIGGFIFSFFLLIDPLTVRAQVADSIKTLENEYRNLYGVEKLRALNQLTSSYFGRDRKKSVKYGRQAVQLAESIFNEDNKLVNEVDRGQKMIAHHLLGQIYYNQEKYTLAKEDVSKAYEEAVALQDSAVIETTIRMLGEIEQRGNNTKFLNKQLKPLDLGDKIARGKNNLKLSSVLILAKKYEQLKQYSDAIAQYKIAVNLSRNKGDASGIADLQSKIATLYDSIGRTEAAAAFYQIATRNYKKLEDTTAVEETNEALRQLLESSLNSKYIAEDTAQLSETEETILKRIDRYKKLSEDYESERNYDQSLKYFKQYRELELDFLERQRRLKTDSIQLMAQAQKIINLEQENELSEIEIAQRENELATQKMLKNWLIGGSAFFLLLAIMFLWLFNSKKKAHQELTMTFEKLEDTRKQLAEAEQKMKKMLGQQVSEDIAEALISDEADQVTIQKFVCVMFLDIRDFTPFASSRTPEEVIAYQNDVFGFMIEIIAKNNGVINQFMGDGFMATFGVPESTDSDVLNAYTAAREIVMEVNVRSKDRVIHPTKIGIGLHAGHVVAGNVGTDTRKQYSITGTTVITAARIEQLNKKYKSQLLISETVMTHLKNYDPKYKKVVEEQLKGMSENIRIYQID